MLEADPNLERSMTKCQGTDQMLALYSNSYNANIELLLITFIQP